MAFSGVTRVRFTAAPGNTQTVWGAQIESGQLIALQYRLIVDDWDWKDWGFTVDSQQKKTVWEAGLGTLNVLFITGIRNGKTTSVASEITLCAHRLSQAIQPWNKTNQHNFNHKSISEEPLYVQKLQLDREQSCWRNAGTIQFFFSVPKRKKNGIRTWGDSGMKVIFSHVTHRGKTQSLTQNKMCHFFPFSLLHLCVHSQRIIVGCAWKRHQIQAQCRLPRQSINTGIHCVQSLHIVCFLCLIFGQTN